MKIRSQGRIRRATETPATNFGVMPVLLTLTAVVVITILLFAVDQPRNKEEPLATNDSETSPSAVGSETHAATVQPKESAEAPSVPPAKAASEGFRSGTATITWGEDFCLSLGKPVVHGGDFRLSDTHTLRATKGIAELGSGVLNKLKALPEYKPGPHGAKRHAYKTEVPIVVGQRYAIVGADGRTYGKIRVIDYDARLLYPAETITFEWAYMPDGGRFYP